MKRLAIGLALLVAIAAYGEMNSTALAQTSKSPSQKKAADAKPVASTGLTVEVYKDAGGKFRFRVKDGEGDNVAMASKGYDKKDDVQKIIKMLQNDFGKAKVVDADK
jgi:uncharacterized protein YegP (UPF0339 family)